MTMILTLPDPIICVAIACCAGPDDITRARNAAKTIREQCGDSELTREWLKRRTKGASHGGY